MSSVRLANLSQMVPVLLHLVVGDLKASAVPQVVDDGMRVQNWELLHLETFLGLVVFHRDIDVARLLNNVCFLHMGRYIGRCKRT